jgi:Flp pilus assembly protein TadD
MNTKMGTTAEQVLTLLSLDRGAEALTRAREAIDLDTVNAENHRVYGDALRALGFHADAVASYDRAIELKPDHAAAYLNRGLALAALDRIQEAASSYDRSIEIQPNNPEAHKYGGDLCSKLRRFEQAEIFYNNAILLKPDYADAYAMRADALRQLGRKEEACASFGKIIDLDPEMALSFGRLNALRSSGHLIELEYPVAPAVRWSDKAPHPQLVKIIGSGDARYAKTIDAFMRLSQPLLQIERDPSKPLAPFWDNGWLSPIDAASVYGFLASRNPRRYVEIGSGNSTMFARRAIADHQLQTQIISIDPSPRVGIDTICDRVVRSRLEHVDLSIFADLGRDDMIFCDNSHYSFQNSDVTVFFLEVLPRLKHGPLIGVHDIFLPYDYPPNWLARFYNEQYLLGCWVLANERLQIELPAHYVASTPALKQRFSPIVPASKYPGLESGFWFTLP